MRLEHRGRESTLWMQQYRVTRMFRACGNKCAQTGEFTVGSRPLTPRTLIFNFNILMYIIVGIITKGGAQPNIIPEEAQLHYYLRAPTVVQLEQLRRKLKQCFDAAAVSTGAQVSVKITSMMMMTSLWNSHLDFPFCTGFI